MADFPTGTELTTNANTVLEQKGYVEDQADAIFQLLGSSALGAETISSGSITPSVAVFTVDTESSAATDDLDNILTTNLHAGAVIAIASLNASRVVTVSHEAGGAGQITLQDSTDRVLETDKWLLLRRSGTDWVELAISQPTVLTTEGDIIVADSSGNEDRLAIGTADQILASDGSTPEWIDAPAPSYSSLGTKTSAGTWTLPNVEVGKLLIIGCSSTNTGVANAGLSVNSGAKYGEVGVSTQAYALGHSGTQSSAHGMSFVVIPDSTTVVFDVEQVDSGITLSAWQ